MPNNIVFNNVAQQLKTQIYGSNATNPVQTDENGQLFINTVDTVSQVSNVASVDVVDTVSAVVTVNQVSNVASVDVVDTVSAVATVSQVSNVASVDTIDQVSNVASVDVVDTVSAVATVSQVSNVASVDTIDQVSNVTSVDVVDTVSAVATVSQVSNVASVDTIDALTEIINTVDVSLVGHAFNTSNTTLTDFNAATTCLQMNTSEKNMYSYYIRNTGSATVIAKLEISPTETEAYFIDDAATAIAIGPGTNGVIIPVKYLNYTRLHLTPADTTTVVAYYNAQS